MLRKFHDRFREIRPNMMGGSGEITIKHFFKPEEIKAKCRLCAEITIPAGSGIGTHEHIGEDEIYIITKGSGIVTENGKEYPVSVGDSVLTGNGGVHSIRNSDSEELILTAIIMTY